MLSLNRIIAKTTILKNFSVLTLSSVLTQFLGIFVSIKIARSLNPLGFGTYNLLQLHVYIFTVVASFGLRNIIIRNIARNKTLVKKVFFTAIILRVVGFFLSIIFFAGYFFLYRHYDTLLFVLVIQCILSTILFDLFESVAFGLEKMEFTSLINLLSSGFWLGSVILIPKSQFTLHLIFGLFVLFSSLKSIAYFFSLYKVEYIKGFQSEYIEKLQIIKFSKESFPYYYLALFTLLSNQIPLLFLEHRSGIAQIGFFNIASKLLMPINLIIDTALAAIFPTLSRLYTTNYRLFVKNVKLIFILITLFCIAGAFCITLFRQDFVRLLYGKEYISSSLVLGYQGWYVAVYSVVCLIGTILSAINKQKELGYMSIICTIIQVPILWYASKFGAQYLSAAFLVATIISFIIHIYVINIYLKSDLSLIFYLKIIALFMIGYFASLLIPVDLNFFFKMIIFMSISIVGGYFIFLNYKQKSWLK